MIFTKKCGFCNKKWCQLSKAEEIVLFFTIFKKLHKVVLMNVLKDVLMGVLLEFLLVVHLIFLPVAHRFFPIKNLGVNLIII